MFRNVIFYDNFTDAVTGLWSSLFWQGVIFLTIGILVLLWPQLLQVMVAGCFIFLGLIFISLGWRAKGVREKYSLWKNEYWEP